MKWAALTKPITLAGLFMSRFPPDLLRWTIYDALYPPAMHAPASLPHPLRSGAPAARRPPPACSAALGWRFLRKALRTPDRSASVLTLLVRGLSRQEVPLFLALL